MVHPNDLVAEYKVKKVANHLSNMQRRQQGGLGKYRKNGKKGREMCVARTSPTTNATNGSQKCQEPRYGNAYIVPTAATHKVPANSAPRIHQLIASCKLEHEE